jgi:hypothetical protein
MLTAYPARVLAELVLAQTEVDRHVAAGRDGRCLACHRTHPCPGLGLAQQTFARYRRLPVRRPGHASRGLVAATIATWLP